MKHAASKRDAAPSPKGKTPPRPPYTMQFVDLTDEDRAAFVASFEACQKTVLERHGVTDPKGWHATIGPDGAIAQLARRAPAGPPPAKKG